MLLFSYTRTHKNNGIDMMIPVFALILIAIVYLEGLTIAADKLGTIGKLIDKIKRR